MMSVSRPRSSSRIRASAVATNVFPSPTTSPIRTPPRLFTWWAAISNVDPVTYEVHLSTVNGFTPSAGQNFTIMTYTGLPVGNFTSFSLPPGCSANPTSGSYIISC